MEYLYETHMHTSEVSACADSSAAEQVSTYLKMGYTGIIVTDHFINGYSTCPKKLAWDKKMEHILTGYVEAKKAGDQCGLDVFLGWEFTINGLDFLTYGLDLEFLISNPDLDKLGLESYSALVRKCGGYLAQAHPYREAWYIESGFPVSHLLVDGIEVYNPMDSEEHNAMALAYAKLHNLPEQAGSDSHHKDTPVLGGIKLQKKAESIFDIIEAIKNREVTTAKIIHSTNKPKFRRGFG